MSGREERAESARRILVSGRVQGVGFRWSTMAAARRLGVAGWVRNRADGRVEVHAQGTPAAVAALVAWLGHGPAGAEVTGLEEQVTPAEAGGGEFAIRQ